MSSGTRMRNGVKFQMAFMPHTTILSATSWALWMGTVRIPIFTLWRRISFSRSFMWHTGIPAMLCPTRRGLASKAATISRPN